MDEPASTERVRKRRRDRKYQTIAGNERRMRLGFMPRLRASAFANVIESPFRYKLAQGKLSEQHMEYPEENDEKPHAASA